MQTKILICVVFGLLGCGYVATEMVGFDHHLRCSANCDELKTYIDCEDAWNDPVNNNPSFSGTYVLELPGHTDKFGTYCEQDHKDIPWTVFQRRIDGSVDFYRDWDTYKNGFGDVRGEFWLGLQRLHKMTKLDDYDLWIHLESFDNKRIDYHYSGFEVGSESEGFQLKLHGYGKGGFQWHDKTKFTTFDRDQDTNVAENCAVKQKSAWWFKNCGWTDLNSMYSQAKQLDTYGIYWAFFHSDEKLKSTMMAIRKTQRVAI